MSLRRGLSLFIIVLATLAIGAGISLVVLTTHLHRATVDMENGLHSVRLAEEMQIDLLTYARTQDPDERDAMERDLRQKFLLARQYVNSPDEDRALSDAEMFLEIHFSDVHQA